MYLQPFKHIIWDWNGTLMDDTDLCVEIINEILKGEKIPLVDTTQYRETFTFPVRHYYERIGLNNSGKSFEKLSAVYIEQYGKRWNQCQLHDGANECLRMIRQAGISQSVLSASEQTTLEKVVAHYEILTYFRGLVGQRDYFARGKLEAGRAWIQELDWDPPEILLIGDTLHDYEVAQQLGLQCILVSFGHQSETVLEAAGLPLIPTMQELRKLLSRHICGTTPPNALY